MRILINQLINQSSVAKAAHPLLKMLLISRKDFMPKDCKSKTKNFGKLVLSQHFVGVNYEVIRNDPASPRIFCQLTPILSCVATWH